MTSRSRSFTSAGIAAGRPGTSVYVSVIFNDCVRLPTMTLRSDTCPLVSGCC